jgi:arylsulfatase
MGVPATTDGTIRTPQRASVSCGGRWWYCAIVAVCLSILVTAAIAAPPNIVLILADDLGYGEIGAFGQDRIATPHLDRLAGEGAMLTQHYSGSPVCAPARCTLLTGLHTGHAAVRDNWENGGWGVGEPEGQFPLPDAEQTLAEILKERGYVTAAIGKWGLGGPGTSGQPNAQGFDHFYGYLCQRKAHNYYPTHLWRNTDRDLLPGNEWFSAHQHLPEDAEVSDADAYREYAGETYAPDLMITEAEAFIEKNADDPFFLYFATPIPHLALQIPDAEVSAYPESWDKAAYPGNRGYLPHPRPRAAYAAMISRFDRDVGRILRQLEVMDVADNTIVIVTSDNGPSWVGGVDRAFFESSGGLRGRKAEIFEGGIRVPTIVRWPGEIEPGSVCDEPSAFWDWLPTLTAIAGGEPVQTDGIDLTDALRGTKFEADRGLYWEFGPWQAYRRGPWKLVRRRKGDTVEVMLFNLVEDPSEFRNLASELSVLADQLIAEATAQRMPSPDFPSFVDQKETQ